MPVRTQLHLARAIALLAATLMTIVSTSHADAAKPVPVMDLHSDILLRVIENDVDLQDAPPWTQVNIPTMRAGGVTDQVFAVWIDSQERHGLDATNRALQIIDKFYTQAELHSDAIELALTTADAERIKKKGKIAVYLWMEGGIPINNDMALLRDFYRLGIRGMTLTWTTSLDWAGSSGDNGPGLSDFGKDVVREMNHLHMIVDLSHVSDQTFYDALAVTTQPVVISHSSCRALCSHPRDVTDDMLRALAKNGGVIGINALPEFLSDKFGKAWDKAEEAHSDEIKALLTKYDNDRGNPEYREARRQVIQAALGSEDKVTLDTFLDHIEHAMKIAGPEHVALGADFDGIWNFPEGLEKASQWQNVVAGLRKRGHSKEEIRGVMGDNARRVFKQVLDSKQ